LLSLKNGADMIFTEEIVDKKFHHCKRIVNPSLGTVDFVNTRDYSIVMRTKVNAIIMQRRRKGAN